MGGDNFHTRALLRTTSQGSLEMIQSSLLVKRQPTDDQFSTDVLFDVDGPVRFGSKTAPKVATPDRRALLQVRPKDFWEAEVLEHCIGS